MRLLSKKQVAQQSFNVEAILQGKLNVIRDEITARTKELNLVNETLVAKKDLAEAENRAFLEEMGRKKESLQAEVHALEERKKEAKKPLDDLKIALEEQEKALSDRKKALSVSLGELDARSHALAEEYETLADRVIQVKEKEERAERMVKGAETQARFVSDQAKMLAERMATFSAMASEKEKQLAQREALLNAREEEMSNKESVVVRMREENAADKRKNQSERDAINAAFTEARKKGFIPL